MDLNLWTKLIILLATGYVLSIAIRKLPKKLSNIILTILGVLLLTIIIGVPLLEKYDKEKFDALSEWLER